MQVSRKSFWGLGIAEVFLLLMVAGGARGQTLRSPQGRRGLRQGRSVFFGYITRTQASRSDCVPTRRPVRFGRADEA